MELKKKPCKIASKTWVSCSVKKPHGRRGKLAPFITTSRGPAHLGRLVHGDFLLKPLLLIHHQTWGFCKTLPHHFLFTNLRIFIRKFRQASVFLIIYIYTFIIYIYVYRIRRCSVWADTLPETEQWGHPWKKGLKLPPQKETGLSPNHQVFRGFCCYTPANKKCTFLCFPGDND